MTAFEPLLPPNKNPDYFIYFEVDPSSLDVNIHPTKTEVKFENEQALWQILMVTVKEALGKFNALPPLDFDREDAIEIPIYDESKPAPMPKVNINPNYNPFHTIQRNTHPNSLPHFDWETLYRGFKKKNQQRHKLIHWQIQTRGYFILPKMKMPIPKFYPTITNTNKNISSLPLNRD